MLLAGKPGLELIGKMSYYSFANFLQLNANTRIIYPKKQIKREQMNTIRKISELLKNQGKNFPMIVAIDGVDASGKTTFANLLHEDLLKSGCNSVRISIDKFHNPKSKRMERGALSPEGFFHDSFDLESLKQLVIQPVKAKSGNIVPEIFDYRVEEKVQAKEIPVQDDMIVLLDGIFLNRDELFEYWDVSIFLDVSFETVVTRALVRDLNAFGSEEEVLKRYNQRYIPGEKLYLSQCQPQKRADIVIDNNDWSFRKILKFPQEI